MVKKSMWMIQSDDPWYWREDIGQAYLREHKAACDRGVEVVRIWLQPKERLLAMKEVILEHEAVYGECYVAEKEAVNEVYRRDVGIVDDYYVVGLDVKEMDDTGIDEWEKVTLIESDVKQSKLDFVYIREHYARRASEYHSQANLVAVGHRVAN